MFACFLRVSRWVFQWISGGGMFFLVGFLGAVFLLPPHTTPPHTSRLKERIGSSPKRREGALKGLTVRTERATCKHPLQTSWCAACQSFGKQASSLGCAPSGSCKTRVSQGRSGQDLGAPTDLCNRIPGTVTNN